MRRRRLVAAFGALAWLLAQPAWAQAVGQTAPQDTESIQKSFGRATCPGDPPGNLGSLNCEFTKTMRLQKFIGGSVTDQALLSASFFGTVAHFRNQPPEWGGGWEGLGKRIGTRYGQSFAKGLAVFGVGLLVRNDPRLVDYASDPLIDKKQRQKAPALARERRGRAWTRIGHAFMDFATVRKSAPMGDGGRQPNWPLFTGAVVSGYVGNLWAPERLTTPQETAKRIGGSLGTALFASFYNEFNPEVGRLLGRLFRRGATSQNPVPPVSQP